MFGRVFEEPGQLELTGTAAKIVKSSPQRG